MLLGSFIWASQHKFLGFSVKKITSTLTHHSEWETPPPAADLFDQNYSYLASGSQSYAFVSADGKYVIKFFRMKHLIPSFSDYFRPERLKRREENLHTIFNAYKLAFDELREESGLVYLHLNKTNYLKEKLHVTDRLGRTHVIDLDKTEFIVQEKAELIFTRLAKLLGNKDAIQQSVDAVLGLVQRRIQKGFADQDKAVSHNYGFVGDRPIHLDIGRIFKGEKKGEYDRIAARIETWLQQHSSQ